MILKRIIDHMKTLNVHNLQLVLLREHGAVCHITIQCDEFVHGYDDNIEQAAMDLDRILSGDDTSTWEGNHPEARQNHTTDFEVYDESDLLALAEGKELTPADYAEYITDPHAFWQKHKQ